MSIQENNLKKIGEAIREVKKQFLPIKASSFHEEILSIPVAPIPTPPTCKLFDWVGNIALEVPFYKGMTFEVPETQPNIEAVRGVNPALNFQGYTHLAGDLENIQYPVNVGMLYAPLNRTSWFLLRYNKSTPVEVISADIPNKFNYRINPEDISAVVSLEDLDGNILFSETIDKMNHSVEFKVPKFGFYWFKVYSESKIQLGSGVFGNKAVFGEPNPAGLRMLNTLVSAFICENISQLNDDCFRNCFSLNRITLSEGISYIGSNVFNKSSGFSFISIPNSVISIKSAAFSGCSSLVSIVLSNSTSLDSGYLFENCSSLKNIYIPITATALLNNIFQNCSSLIKIIIPENVIYIGGNAFSGCISISEFKLPDGVTYIGNNAFQNCYSATDINIPSGVTEIGSRVFMECFSLKKLVLPDALTKIGDSAFLTCRSLSEINIPDSVLKFGANVFQNCSSLIYMKIPNGVTTIGSQAFGGCVSIRKLILPDTVTSMASNSIQGCASLVEFNIPSKITEILDYTFNNNSSVLKYIIPEGITKIGNYSFNGCFSVNYYDFRDVKVVPIIQPTTFNVLTSKPLMIIVSDVLYSQFITATNWVTIENYIIKESDYIEIYGSI